MLRALIVDDEPPARDLLRRLLAVHADHVEIVGEARSVADAAEKYQRLRPDLVFLDIQMPREDGFALLPRLGAPAPAVIFVTAYDAFAVRAFEVNAVDYLLKPVAPDRLARALARVAAPIATATIAPAPAIAPLHATDTVFLQSDRGIRTATVAAITHIEAEENYTRVHLTDGPPVLIRRTMAEWESVLPVDLFVRVERSLLLNRAAIQRVDRISRDVAHAHVAGRAGPLALARRASLRLRRSLRVNPAS
ncbi:LytR/AlgR family response regulator transcription factor [Opitutus terrae]|uniref:Two component transcriptional regulator, LytTR family n=1 Tax=Opitutus terrae (strain DSM 11246 / JCM 15787 / PB90-1) TaxID=452637 RepID=B1ZNG8_OPITP|nr:response regulator transcription factor [Opitutus terrae]ACB74402.1 two component transcriptional regulator, LytTR family [Opitutus terrae PB90-1]